MPIADSTERGNLYVFFEVVFPSNYFLQEKDLKVQFDINNFIMLVHKCGWFKIKCFLMRFFIKLILLICY